jgi:3',5'-cyclic AMP phosphodiesterase CpdA
VALDGTCVDFDARECAAGSPQLEWLRADLAAHPAQCTVAYYHEARWSSGEHGSQRALDDMWSTLHEFGVDVVLSGHDHIYERFAPQDDRGELDLVRGTRQFTIGTGGRDHGDIRNLAANSEVRIGDTFGVLKVTLDAGSYSWQFVPVAGETATDSGTDVCR